MIFFMIILQEKALTEAFEAFFDRICLSDREGSRSI
jgi:hypothetical protein